MSRTIIGRVLVLLLLAALLAPVLETFDRWDATPGLAGDTEFHVAALAAAAGLIAAVAFVAVRAISPLLCIVDGKRKVICDTFRVACAPSYFAGSSPPTAPLRI